MYQLKQLIKETKKYLTKYDYEKVSEYCDKILEIEPNSSWGLQFKGISLFQRGKYEEAIPYYEKLLLLYPEDNEVKYTLAFLNEKIGNNEEALSYYNKINDNFVYQKRTRLLTKMGRYDILIKEYDEKLASLKADKEEYDTEMLVLMEEKAVFHYRNDEYDEAYRIFKEISDNYPRVLKTITHPMKRCEGWYNVLHYCLKEYEKPREFFNNFFILDDEDDGVWSVKLLRNISCGDPFIFGDFLIELNPYNVGLLERYGDFADYHYPEYALNCFHKILEIEPYNRKIIDKIISIYSKDYSKDKALKLIDSKIDNTHLCSDLLKQKIELLESMTLYSEALDSYEEYFKYATGNDEELTSMKVNHLICMELYALDLYNQDKLEQAYNVLKDVFYNFRKITNYYGEQVSVAWYTNVLKDALDKSDDNPKEFFNYFFTPDDKQTELWIKKIDSIASNFKPQKRIGNKSYYDILSDYNPDNMNWQ